MNKQSKNKKKLGYNQYSKLLAQAHQKSDFLAQKYQELQAYFIGYVEYRGDNIAFNDWMAKRMKELQKEEQVNEKV